MEGRRELVVSLMRVQRLDEARHSLSLAPESK